MGGNGPAGNPNAQRRNARVGLTRLPGGGRRKPDGKPLPTPTWPLPENPKLTAKVDMLTEAIEELEEKDLDEGLSRTEITKLSRTRERLRIAQAEQEAIRKTERSLWRDLWKTPQAVEWERLRWTREVAQYVRHKAAAEIGSLEDSREARLRAEALGLTPKGLRSLLWTIDHDELGERRDQQSAAATGTDGGAPPAADAAPRRRLKAVDQEA